MRSEIYDETDFSSVAMTTGSESSLEIDNRISNRPKLFLDVISKFRFDLPANREEVMKGLEHDDDSDVIVPRRKNECIEIGMLIMNLKVAK